MSAAKVASEWAKGWPKIVAGQKAIQTSPVEFVHRKLGDSITSQVIPLALSAVGAGLTLHGIYRMVRGIKE